MNFVLYLRIKNTPFCSRCYQTQEMEESLFYTYLIYICWPFWTMPEISIISALQNNSDLLFKGNQFLKLCIQYCCSDLLPNWRRMNFCWKNTVLLSMLYCIMTVRIWCKWTFLSCRLLKIDIYKAYSLRSTGSIANDRGCSYAFITFCVVNSHRTSIFSTWLWCSMKNFLCARHRFLFLIKHIIF